MVDYKASHEEVEEWCFQNGVYITQKVRSNWNSYLKIINTEPAEDPLKAKANAFLDYMKNKGIIVANTRNKGNQVFLTYTLKGEIIGKRDLPLGKSEETIKLLEEIISKNNSFFTNDEENSEKFKLNLSKLYSELSSKLI